MNEKITNRKYDVRNKTVTIVFDCGEGFHNPNLDEREIFG